MSTSGSEREGLSRSLRSQMGYGTAKLAASTKKHTPKTKKFISRTVQRTDNLVGLALKYGVSVQDLKRENKLWNPDHLFLRETLLIPLTSDNESCLDEHDRVVVYDGNSEVTSPTSTTTTTSVVATATFEIRNEASGDHHNHRHKNHHPATTAPTDGGGAPSISDPLTAATSSLPGQSSLANGASSSSSSSSSNPHSSSLSSSRRNGSSTTTPTTSSSSSSGIGDGGISSSSSGGSSMSAMDFFSKYDTSIARLKGDIAKLESNAAAGLSMASTTTRTPYASCTTSVHPIPFGAGDRSSPYSSMSSYQHEAEFVENETCC